MIVGPDIYCVRLVGGPFDKYELNINHLPHTIRMPLQSGNVGDRIPLPKNVHLNYIEYCRAGRDRVTTQFLYEVMT